MLSVAARAYASSACAVSVKLVNPYFSCGPMAATSKRPVPVLVFVPSVSVKDARLSTGGEHALERFDLVDLVAEPLYDEFALPHSVTPVLFEPVAGADSDVVGQQQFAGDGEDFTAWPVEGDGRSGDVAGVGAERQFVFGSAEPFVVPASSGHTRMASSTMRLPCSSSCMITEIVNSSNCMTA